MLQWAFDLEDLESRVVRVWLHGGDTILGDAPSRYPEDREVLRNKTIPCGPANPVIEKISTTPDSPGEQNNMSRFMQAIESADVESIAAKSSRKDKSSFVKGADDTSTAADKSSRRANVTSVVAKSWHPDKSSRATKYNVVEQPILEKVVPTEVPSGTTQAPSGAADGAPLGAYEASS